MKKKRKFKVWKNAIMGEKMKPIGLVLFCCLTLPCFAFAQNVSERVSLSEKQVTLQGIFKELEKQTSFSFLYNNRDLEGVGKMDITLRNVTLNEALRECLQGSKLTYEIVNNQVIIRKNDKKEGIKNAIEGSVKDEYGDPLPGVTISIKGTTVGVISDKDGKYTLMLPSDRTDLFIRFSFIGKKMLEVKYDEQQRLDVVLHDDVQEVEEVVVTGYQTMDKRYSTSAITTIKVEDILLPGVATIDKMLEGHVPGMIFMQNSAQVGATPRLRIRGTSTILGNQEPLWVVDGIIQQDPVNISPDQLNDLDFVNLLGNAISGLNPNDIEQIDVLKDASATALYGARAANGVIVITTKKGNVGPPAISYNVAGTYSRRPRYTDRSVHMMNSAERIDYSREAVEKRINYNTSDGLVGYEKAWTDYTSGAIDLEGFQREVAKAERQNTDWFDLICQDVFSHNHTLSVSGGAPELRYYVSLGYNRENGVLKKESGERYNANIRLTANYKKLTAQFGLSGNIYDRRYTPSEVSLLNYAYNMTRAVPAYDENGNYWFYRKDGSRQNSQDIPFNILNERDHSSDRMKNDAVSFNTSLAYRFTEALKGEVTFSYSTSHMNREVYRGEQTFYARDHRRDNGLDSRYAYWKQITEMPVGGELKEDNTQNRSYTLRAQLNYHKFVDDDRKHLLALALGAEVSSSRYTGSSRTIRGYVPERGLLITGVDLIDYPAYAQWLSTSKDALGTRKDQLTNMASGYITATYSYNDRYVFNANMRIDGSNKFGTEANDKLLPIWSVSGLWHMKNDLLKRVNWVDRLSLRTSFGFQGNMLDHETPELIIKQEGIHQQFGEYYSTVYSFPNPNLKWEKTKSFNLSLEFILLKNAIRGEFSYYYKRTTDAFLTKRVMGVNGVDQYTVNKGTLENQGFEVALNIIPVNSLGGGDKDFRWSIDPQLGQVLNKLLNKAIEKKANVLHDKYTYNDYLNGKVQVSGKPLNSFFSYQFEGLDHETGRPLFAHTDKEEFESRYADMEKEEVFMTVMEHSGTRVPVLQGGIRNTFSYKNCILSFNLTYSLGSKVRLLRLYSGGSYAAKSPAENVRKEFLNRWRVPGDEKYTDIPGIVDNDTYKKSITGGSDYYWWSGKPYVFAGNIWSMYDNSEHRVVSGNYLKLQDISLRYIIPAKLCSKFYLKSAYVSFSGTNLFTWSAKVLKGQDPATQSGSATDINLSLRPSYTFNLNVTF